MPLPTFLVLGAARAGTTSLHYYLRRHPQIAMSLIKEPNFFLFDHRRPDRPSLVDDRRIEAKSVRDPKKYESVFRADGPETRAFGDASPLYLYTAETPEVVRSYLDDVKLLALLRDPVDRAYSHFRYIDGQGGDGVVERFAAAAEREAGLPYAPYRSGTHVLRLGRYGEQVARYRATFPREALHVEFYEDLRADSADRLAAICDFVGVDHHPDPEWDTYNASAGAGEGPAGPLGRVARKVQPWVKGILPARVAGRLAEVRVRRGTAAPPPPLPADLRARLQAYYADDVELLRTLVDRPVPASWTEAPTPT